MLKYVELYLYPETEMNFSSAAASFAVQSGHCLVFYFTGQLNTSVLITLRILIG